MIPPEWTKPYRDANYAQLHQFTDDLLNRAAQERQAEQAWWLQDPQKLQGKLGQLRQAMMRDLGYPPPMEPEPNSLPAETLIAEEDGLRFYRLVFHIAHGLDSYGILVKPATPGPHRLCVLLHGASGCPEMITGLHVTANYYDAGKRLARDGWMVYAPLMVFPAYVDGENTTVPQDGRLQLDRLLHAADTSLVALEMAKIIRSTDLLLKRPDVMPGRAAIAGLSFGGFYTLLCAAADQRFDPVYASCFFADQISVFREQPNTHLGEFVWAGSALRGSCTELAIACCPRTLILETGVGDPLFYIEKVRREVPRVQQIYACQGAAHKFHYVEHNGQHEFGLGEALRYFWQEDPE